MSEINELPTPEDSQNRRLSYKFQRLRERIRSAIESGELEGKLPGERILARRFKVNAKTLSKALTDLAAEGLLERNIGLGTFVRGSNQHSRSVQKCLILIDADQATCPAIALLQRDERIDWQVYDNVTHLPPSLVNPHDSIIVCSRQLGDDVLRDLVVRGKTVVVLDRHAPSYATHSVIVDRVGAACDMARKLMHAGHHDVMLVGESRPIELHEQVRSLLPSSLVLRVGALADVAGAAGEGVSGLVCVSPEVAREAITICRDAGAANVSVLALGRVDGEPPCSGQYVSPKELASSARHLLSDATSHRPIAIWLAGEYMDRHTLAPHNAATGRPPLRYDWCELA